MEVAAENELSAERWLRAMLKGDFEAAWRESDAIRARGGPDPHRFWQGEDLRGKRVIVRCLHGFGDTAQMLRYAPALNAMAETVTWEVPPRMVAIAPFFRGVERVATWGEETSAWDAQVEVMELPYLMRTHPEELPLAAGYLALPHALIATTAISMGEKLRPCIGLVWAGGDWNPSRSIPFALLEPLLKVTGVEWWNLQGGKSASEGQGSSFLRNAAAKCGEGQLALAAAIANLDLVITVDTLAAHLAGAMGKPVWVVLQSAADWRWMNERADSPWYPSMRLFRQRTPGDWAGVVSAVVTALRDFAP